MVFVAIDEYFVLLIFKVRSLPNAGLNSQPRDQKPQVLRPSQPDTSAGEYLPFDLKDKRSPGNDGEGSETQGTGQECR